MTLGRILTLGVLLLASSVALAGKPIVNIENETVPPKFDGGERTLEEVRKAIAAGCKGKGWRPVSDSDTRMTCSILVRGRHYAEVKIDFSASEYSITYSDSRELDYEPEKQEIHRKYNGWVMNLNTSIQRQFPM